MEKSTHRFTATSKLMNITGGGVLGNVNSLSVLSLEKLTSFKVSCCLHLLV